MPLGTQQVQPRALGLVSGGLDSLLAARLMVRLGFDARAVHFRTGFVKPARERALQPAAEAPGLGGHCLPPRVVDVREPYLEQVVLSPKYGYGSGMNPCIDCRIFMLRQAKLSARDQGIEVVFTGDVIGQRAFDQSRSALRRIEEDAGLEGEVLRPLSAGLLDPTVAERNGWVQRGSLLRLHGRGRAGQLDLARELGLEAFPTPSGGCCRLADRAFARRLRDLVAHRVGAKVCVEDTESLGLGRHFRLAWDLKVIVGRDAGECARLARRAGDRLWTVAPVSGTGTLALLEGRPDAGRLAEAGRLVARYSGNRAGTEREVVIRGPGTPQRICAVAADARQLERWRI